MDQAPKETTPSPAWQQAAELRHERARVWAKEAGALLQSRLGRVTPSQKGDVNFVTEADHASEALLLGNIRASFPEDAILAEESGEQAGEGFRWIVDPLDGTTNFVHGNPLYVVSVAVERLYPEGERPDAAQDRICAAVIYNPAMDELFEAPPGGGAWCKGRRLAMSEVDEATRALFVTGFPYYRREIVDDLLARVKRALMTGHGLRRSGSAALDLAWLAAGRTDAFWEEGLKAYDVAAGLRIIAEAGGCISDWRGAPYRFGGNEICATNGRIHDEVLAAVCAPAASVSPRA